MPTLLMMYEQLRPLVSVIICAPRNSARRCAVVMAQLLRPPYSAMLLLILLDSVMRSSRESVSKSAPARRHGEEGVCVCVCVCARANVCASGSKHEGGNREERWQRNPC